MAFFLVLLMAGLYSFQDRLLYHPDSYDRAILSKLLRAQGGELWPSAEGFKGILHAPRREPVRGTVLVFHGNAGSAVDRSFYAERLAPLGFRVILVEYPGYGPRAGTPSESSLAEDGAEAALQAQRQFGGPIYLLGESLGAGVAAAVYSRTEAPIAGILLVTPWDNLPSVAQSIYWFLPVRWLVRDAYDSIEHLARFAGPLGIVLAERDEIIPRACTIRLFESFAGQKKLWIAKEAGHNTWPGRVGPEFWQDVVGFLEIAASALPGSGPS